MENKKTLIAIIILVIIIIGLIVLSLFSVNQVNILTEESNKLLQMDIVKEEIDVQIKTKGSYATVEKAMKEYLQELKNIYIEMEELQEEINPEDIFSVQNIEDKNLEEIDAIINEYKEKSKTYYAKYKELVKEENITENINNKNISIRKDYYVDLYNTVMLGDIMKNQYSNLEEEIEHSKDKMYDKMNKIENIKLYLEKSSNYWTIKDEKIIFTNTNIMIEYYNLMNELSE